jgi:hypothetical protein
MALQLLKFLAISMGSAAVVTAALVLIAPPLAALTRRLIYPQKKTDRALVAASTSR